MKRSDVPAGESLCDYCSAKCCRYFAFPIDRPKKRQDFDYLRWFMLHGAWRCSSTMTCGF